MLIAAFNQGALAAKIFSESKAKENPCETACLRVDDHCEDEFELPMGEMVFVPS